jgi:hypothetical protein
MKTLEQKTYFQTATFTIDDTGLLRTFKGRTEESEYHFSFETITTNKSVVVEDKRGLLVLACASAIPALIFMIAKFTSDSISFGAILFWMAVSGVLFYSYFKNRHKLLFIHTGDSKQLKFYAEKPSCEEVNAFAEQLIEARNAYLFSKYGQPTRHLDYASQLNNLNWLLNSRAVSKKVYDEKLNELNALFGHAPSNATIGFTTNN